MPRGRGGKRQGTPGKAYSNRTDMGMDYNMGAGSPAAGGQQAPAEQQPLIRPAMGADQIPNLSDPTMRPGEPVTAGLSVGPGAGPEALGPLPPPPMDPLRMAIQAMMMVAPNPDLVRVMNRLNYEGR
jgi:hypothetical protein